MKEFFHSWVFKVLLALCIVMFAFLLRATMTMGASTVVEQIVGTITAPVQSLTSGLSGSITGFLDQFLRASEISQENEQLREENRKLIELRRKGIQLCLDQGACFIDQVDRLIRQEPVGNVTV